MAILWLFHPLLYSPPHNHQLDIMASPQALNFLIETRSRNTSKTRPWYPSRTATLFPSFAFSNTISIQVFAHPNIKNLSPKSLNKWAGVGRVLIKRGSNLESFTKPLSKQEWRIDARTYLEWRINWSLCVSPCKSVFLDPPTKDVGPT